MLRQNLERLRDPALQGRWVAQISGIPTSDLIIENITPGFVKIGTVSRFYGGRQWNFPGTALFDPIGITFYEPHTYESADFMQRWLRLIYDVEAETYGVPADYLMDITVDLFPVNSSERAAARFTLSDTFPADQNALDLNYTNAEGRNVCVGNFYARKSTFILL